ncbi:hypothetical protein H696_02701 [Fonticula alba]|uniref:DUF4203 domain-containing protein n=1 Tax=Fonticula alba TaxID=691883 RepID=A0A058ZA08_FONAL|nr:hypothetical protein H696_02701 [Fonticula alba]KCV70367.1 hypothetical protein H696_02701 [Fonticula alba]|eukprot:XP_009494883.1 hypothetical protein H696_02701 [Fonticula alba]
MVHAGLMVLFSLTAGAMAGLASAASATTIAFKSLLVFCFGLLGLALLTLQSSHLYSRRYAAFFALAVGGISCGPIFLLSPLEVGTTAIVVACIIILAALTYAVFNTRRILHSCTPGEVVPGTVMLLTDPVRVPALFLWHLLRRSRLFGGSRGGHDAFPSP